MQINKSYVVTALNQRFINGAFSTRFKGQDPQSSSETRANQLISSPVSKNPQPSQDLVFSRHEALSLLMEGNIQRFNQRLKQWRATHPREYFDLRGADFGSLLQGLKLVQVLNPGQYQDIEIDFRSVDLREANFRGIETLKALFTAEHNKDTMEMDALLDNAQFSPSTNKVVT